jgi:hypothetical protein
MLILIASVDIPTAIYCGIGSTSMQTVIASAAIQITIVALLGNLLAYFNC